MRTLLGAGLAGLIGLLLLGGPAVVADTHVPAQGTPTESLLESDDFLAGLAMPEISAARGRILFASKGCVACHSINGIGGKAAPRMDASTMMPNMNPFTFAARMWRGAETMVALQRRLFGEPIDLSGQDLADIIGFVHDAEEQKKFSEADIPHDVLKLLRHSHSNM